MQVMIESERARSREHADSLKAHYKSLDDNRTELTRMILALSQQQQQAAQALATAQPSPQLGAIEAQIKDLGEQVAELADDDEEVQAAMAKLSENPNDLERALTAFQNIVGALANSPIGQALAQKLEQQPQPSHPHYDPDQ
jgi:chromosome segregation ATPase